MKNLIYRFLKFVFKHSAEFNFYVRHRRRLLTFISESLLSIAISPPFVKTTAEVTETTHDLSLLKGNTGRRPDWSSGGDSQNTKTDGFPTKTRGNSQRGRAGPPYFFLKVFSDHESNDDERDNYQNGERNHDEAQNTYKLPQ